MSAQGESTDPETQNYRAAVAANEANWKAVLAFNQNLKTQAKPWPELMKYLTFSPETGSVSGAGHEDFSVPFFLEGDDVVISFSGDMGAISFSVDTSVDQSSSSGTDLSTDGDSSASLGGQISVAGFGLSANINWDYSNSRDVSSGSDSDSGNERTLSFELSDPDRGDTFDVIVRRDPVYNPPIFITRSGRSRCKNETGTVARESLQLSWAGNATRTENVQTVSLEVYNTGLDTELESFSYYLNLDTETNIYGWSVTANGVPMFQYSVRFTVPSRNLTTNSINILVAITNANGVKGTATLRFRLTGICYEDIISPGQYAMQETLDLALTF